MLVLTPAIAQDEEPPLLVFTEDMCEIEITPAELEMLIDTPLDFYTIYAEMMRCESPEERYKCQGCRDKGGVFNECLHFSLDRREPCAPTHCIRNTVRGKSCYVSNAGVEECRVVFDREVRNPSTGEDGDWWAKQEVFAVPRDRRCNTNMNDPQRWQTVFWIGCPQCSEFPMIIRCRTDSCGREGEKPLETRPRWGRFRCADELCRPIRETRTPEDPGNPDNSRRSPN